MNRLVSIKVRSDVVYDFRLNILIGIYHERTQSNQTDIKLQYCLANNVNWWGKTKFVSAKIVKSIVRFKIILGTRFEC